MSRAQSPGESAAEVVASTTATTTATDAAANASAARTRAAMRTTGGAGRVRSHACHGVPRSIAPETPNWKKPTPRTEKAA
jgi:hypothetical protein